MYAVEPQSSRSARSVTHVFLCVLCVLCGSYQELQADVSDYLGKTVASVRLVLEGRDTTDPALTEVTETAVGRPLSMVQVRETITHLFSLGRFEDVSVDATLENGSVLLQYNLTPIHPVTRIRFAGRLDAPGVDEGALRRTILDRYGASPPVGRAADMTRLMEDVLRERGYLHPSIAIHAETAHTPEHATLVFTIDPGERTRIGRIDIVGRPTVSRPDLISRLGLATGAPFQRDALNQRIARYIEERRSRGYYEAVIVPTVQLIDGDRTADLTLTVTPGPRVRVVFAGDPLPQDRRAELVPVEREGSVDEDLLEDSSSRIEEYFRAEGYRDVAAPYSRQEANEELTITFTVTKGRLYRVATVDILENASVPRAEFDATLRLREGQPFSDARLDADVATIEELYRRRGFAAVRVQSAVEPQAAPATGAAPAQVPVLVRIVVREGARTVVDAVTFSGNTAVSDAALRPHVQLQPGAPYMPGQVAADRDAVQLAYQNQGYESATVEAIPEFSADRTHVAVRFAVREGPRIFVDHVLIVGNVRTKSETIEREMQVKAGDPFSLSAINESQRRLAALGLFRRARIAELRHGNETTRDLLVTVEEAPPTTVGVGGGLEGRLRAVGAEDKIDIAPRAFFEIGRRNLFGKNRSLNFFSSVSQSTATPRLTEYRLLATLREPRLLDTAIDGFVTGSLEQQRRSSFNFTRAGVSANAARRLTPKVTLTGNYQIQRTRVFDNRLSPEDQPLIDRAFPQFRLSSFAASLIRDTRNDTVDPGAGEYVSASSQLAAQAIGSEVGFVKSFFTAQMFRTIPGTSRLIVAGNARLGTATGFTAGEQLPASERFFAGGDTTNRGFALDRLGVRHIPAQPGDTLDQNGVPIGGNSLLLFNAELRAPVAGGLGVVGFLDVGNVFARTSDLDLAELRSAVGTGIRYKSPFGPVRLDFGFKVKPRPREGLMAWAVSFGQAF